MRTLKKSLALVLALVMVLGLGVVGASADNALDNYTDTGDIGDAYLEAVGVLTGLGIVDGMTDTTIEPDGTYTRAQAAKIVATMLLGVDAADSLKATTAPFEDVPTYHWASGYIAYCVEAGIIDGMTATTFEPEGTLTGFQWAKMLLSAVGFGVNGEFEGDSWSLNTATVGHQSGLFTGDLDGADHVALRREQAMLYAFNALTKLPQVTYSSDNNNYLYGILGYAFADGTGTTLGWDTFKLKSVEGMVIDNEGMGASATYVDSTNAREGDVKIAADTGLDLMYHAVRAWYVNDKNHTGAYVYDLATVEATDCPTAKNISDARADSKIDATIGTGVDYELYEIDNSALDLDDASVVLKVGYGTYGYADPATKNTTINTTSGKITVKTDDVKSDVSELKYNDSVLYLITNSVKEAATASDAKEALYVAAVTGTVGTVKSYSQSGGQFTVTLEDGTELKESNFYDVLGSDIEFFTIGQTYTFYLDTHGHVMRATRDGARTLYVYTGETRNTGAWDDISSDQGIEYRFLNVTTGEEYWADVYSTNVNGNPFRSMERGTYVDISAGTNAAGQHTAEIITARDETYAAGYVVDNWTAVFNGNQDELWAPNVHDSDVYFDADTITFLVATGTGRNMTVTPYTGVAAFKEAMGVPSNGRIELSNAALTVAKTVTGDWEASVVFVLAENVETVSNYVFLAKNIPLSNWSTVGGNTGNYYVTYNDGVYMNGVASSITLNLTQLWQEYGRNGILDRGFYTLTVTYDRNGNPTYVLDEKVDNEDLNLCFYDTARFTATGSNASTTNWKLNGFAVDSDVTIVDASNPTHNITSVYEAWVMVKNLGYKLAFTVDPYTRTVDVIYVVNQGWDAQVTIGLTSDLQKAGWVITKIGDNTYPATDKVVSKTFNDDEAEKLVGKNIDVVLYNAKLSEYTVSGPYTLTVNDVDAYSALTKGYIGLTIDVDSMKTEGKDNNFTIGGLVIEDVELKLDNSDHKFKGLAAGANLVVGDIVLGETVDFDFSQVNGNFNAEVGKVVWTGTYLETIDLTGTLYEQGDVLYVSVDDFIPLTGSVNTIESATWEPVVNP